MSGADDAKAVLRARMTRTLAEIRPADAAAWSAAIVAHLLASAAWRDARAVLAFAALPGEPDLSALWQPANRGGRTLCLPRTRWSERAVEAVPVDDPVGGTVPGRHGLREPPPDAASVGTGGLDLILVPGLAFDARGGRLGRGAGFYDRLLARADRVRTRAVGVCFASQLLPAVPVRAHDAPVSAVVTPHGLIAVPEEPAP